MVERTTAQRKLERRSSRQYTLPKVEERSIELVPLALAEDPAANRVSYPTGLWAFNASGLSLRACSSSNVTNDATTDILVSLVGTFKESSVSRCRTISTDLPFGYKALSPRPVIAVVVVVLRIQRYDQTGRTRGNTGLVHVSEHFNGCLETGYIKPLSIL